MKKRLEEVFKVLLVLVAGAGVVDIVKQKAEGVLEAVEGGALDGLLEEGLVDGTADGFGFEMHAGDVGRNGSVGQCCRSVQLINTVC